MRLDGLPDAPKGTVWLLGDGWAAVAGSERGVVYFIRTRDRFCCCKSFEHRRTCYHLDAVAEEMRTQDALAAALEKALKKDRLPDEATLRKMFG